MQSMQRLQDRLMGKVGEVLSGQPQVSDASKLR
jgi:hypothetical protein